MEQILAFYKEYIKLEEVLRAGWLMRNVGVERKESDSDHTLQTILLAFLIIRKYNLKDLDLLKVVEMLAFHEIGEIVIGDIPMIADNYTEKKQREEEAVKSKLSSLGSELSSYYFNLWQEFAHKTSREGKFAYFIDHMDAVVKAKVYDYLLGTDNLFNEFYPHAIGLFESSDNEFGSLLSELSK